MNNSSSSSNLVLIYEYTEKHLKKQNESLSRLNSNLHKLFALNLVLFFYQIPNFSFDRYYLFYSLAQIAAIALLGISIFVLYVAIIAQAKGLVIAPKVLMSSKWIDGDKDELLSYIISAWIQTGEEYNRVGLIMQKNFLLAVNLTFLALLCIALRTFLSPGIEI